jgi:hypothetical protein
MNRQGMDEMNNFVRFLLASLSERDVVNFSSYPAAGQSLAFYIADFRRSHRVASVEAVLLFVWTNYSGLPTEPSRRPDE